MRSTFAALVVASLLCSSAFAAPQSVAPLPSGKPAGVKQAGLQGNFMLVLLSAGIAIGGIALAISNPGNNGVTTPSTSATGTGLP